MPETDGSQQVGGQPEPQAPKDALPPPPGNQNPPAASADGDPQENKSSAEELESIAQGERWLIGIGIASVIVNVALGLIYYLQLTQMRLATQQATAATQASQESAYAACVGAEISRETLIALQNGANDTHTSTMASVYQAMAATRSESAVAKLGYGELILFPYLRSVYDIINLGNTDARSVKFKVRAVLVPRDEDPAMSYPKGQFVYGDTPLLHKVAENPGDKAIGIPSPFAMAMVRLT